MPFFAAAMMSPADGDVIMLGNLSKRHIRGVDSVCLPIAMSFVGVIRDLYPLQELAIPCPGMAWHDTSDRISMMGGNGAAILFVCYDDVAEGVNGFIEGERTRVLITNLVLVVTKQTDHTSIAGWLLCSESDGVNVHARRGVDSVCLPIAMS